MVYQHSSIAYRVLIRIKATLSTVISSLVVLPVAVGSNLFMPTVPRSVTAMHVTVVR